MNYIKDLSIFNRITFVEKNHSYLIDGQPSSSLSVTKLLKKFKRQFDSELVARRVAKKRRTTPQVILTEWESHNRYSTTIGSMVHKYIENFYGNKRIEFDGDLSFLEQEQRKKIFDYLPVLIKYFQNFAKDHSNLLCVKSEMVLGDLRDTRVCGMCDALVYNTNTDRFEILDFKTNKKMEQESPWGNLLYPFDDMSEGEINEYTIQLNCYKYFIEKYTSIKIDALKIVWLNSNNANYKLIELPFIETKVKLMFDRATSFSLFEE
jgi:hypothetical protein